MAKIELKNINKIYPNGTQAAKDISFSAEDGEFIVLVGPSGCGKSTILRMIAGLEDISSGELFFDGKKVNDLPSKSRDIGMVFQNYALYPHLTVRDNLAFPLQIKKVSKAEIKSRVEETAEMLGISKLLSKKPKEISGGERQRVALGRAIIRKPRFFLFDEPLSNLDAKLRVQMRTEIINLHRKLGVTSVYVTHDQTEAMTMGTKIILLKDGVLQQNDSPDIIYNSPKNLFTAGFIGSPQINMFEGFFDRRDGLRFIGKNNDFSFVLENSDKFNYLAKEVKELTFAIRPESISLSNIQPESNSWIESEIVNIEYLGYENLVYFKIANELKSVRTESSDKYKIGSKVFFVFDTSKLIPYDKNGNIINI